MSKEVISPGAQVTAAEGQRGHTQVGSKHCRPRALWLLLLGVCAPLRFLKPSEVVGGSQPNTKETTECFPSIYLVNLRQE